MITNVSEKHAAFMFRSEAKKGSADFPETLTTYPLHGVIIQNTRLEVGGAEVNVLS
jgi:hypothetical protein